MNHGIESNKEFSISRAGWSIPEWCTATSISRASFYLLTHKPQTVKLGRRTVVIESPQSYLQRIAELSAASQKAA